MPQRGGKAGRQLRLFHPDPGREPDVHDRRGDRPRRGRHRRAQPLHFRSHQHAACFLGSPRDLPRGHPSQRGQVGPLVLVFLHRPWVQEHGSAVIAVRLEQGRGDQVADTSSREEILRREQPVVTGQVRPPAQRHRLPQQPDAHTAGRLRRDRGSEEHPRVGAHARPRYLQRRGDLECPGSLEIHQRVEYRPSPAQSVLATRERASCLLLASSRHEPG